MTAQAVEYFTAVMKRSWPLLASREPRVTIHFRASPYPLVAHQFID